MAVLRWPLIALTLSACRTSPPRGDGDAPESEAAATHDSGDVAAVDDGGGASETPSESCALNHACRWTLAGGGTVVGQWLHTYEAATWIFNPVSARYHLAFRGGENASDLCTVAVFPDAEVTAAEPMAGVCDLLPWEQDRGISFPHLPVNGTWFVYASHDTYHLTEDGYGDFAWDLIQLGQDGLAYQGAGTANSDYWAYGAEVRAVRSGTIAEVVRSMPENSPGQLGAQGANLVGVAVGGGYHHYYLHLRGDTMPPDLEVGNWIEVGTLLGTIGNSGYSLAPHLHLVALYIPDSNCDLHGLPLRAWSIPAVFDQIERWPLGASDWSVVQGVSPGAGDSVRNLE